MKLRFAIFATLGLTVFFAVGAIGKVEIGPTAIFGQAQSLWPSLKDTTNSTRIQILPVHSVFMDEVPVCDSCDRLTPTVIEFSLPAWHRELFQGWSKGSVEVLSAGDPLLFGDTTWFDTLFAPPVFPWQSWLNAPTHGVVFRNRDTWVSDSVKTALSVLGGKLGASHLLVFDSVLVRLRPWSRGSHHGSFRFSFRLVFWNVALSQPEWATCIASKGGFWSDLDSPWEIPFQGAFQTWKEQIPLTVKRILQEEPR